MTPYPPTSASTPQPEPIGTAPRKRRKDPSRIPVRGAIGLGVTAAGMAFLLSLRPPAVGGELAFAVEPADDAAVTTTALAQADPTTEPAASASPVASADACATTATANASADPAASTDPAASADPAVTTDPCATAAPEASATPAATATPEATGLTGTATGDAVSFRYGTVQVEVTVENGVITDVTALQLPDEDRKSLNISNQVEPMLQSEALQAQSADLDVISGATYTSLAYAQSLQSALDRLAA